MFETKLLDLSKLKGKEKDAFKHLLSEEKHRAYLSGHDPMLIEGSELVCIGALDHKKPVGIIIGAAHPHSVPSELYVVTADSAHRGQGIESALLKEFDEILEKRRVKKIKVLYQIEAPTTEPFEKILEENQWEKGVLAIVKLYFNAVTFNPPWIHNSYPLPEGCELFDWKNLTKEERKDLEYLVDQRAIPGYLSPFIKESLIHYNTSVGLRFKGEVIGWMITHWHENDTIEFRSLFVFRDYYAGAYAMRLLSEAIHRTQKNPPRYARMDVYMPMADTRWLKFIRQRLMPYTEKVERFSHAWKTYPM